MDRKAFLKLVGGSALFAAAAPALDAATAEAAPGTHTRLDPSQRAALDALAAEIIPAGEGMPSAAEVGAAAYLERAAAGDVTVAAALREALATVEHRAQARHGRGLAGVPPSDREALLRDMEKEEPDRFRAARDLVYEAYYTNPIVWQRLGYDFIGADRSGPPLEPFEEALLERVRALPRLYRPVP